MTVRKPILPNELSFEHRNQSFKIQVYESGDILVSFSENGIKARIFKPDEFFAFVKGTVYPHLNTINHGN